MQLSDYLKAHCKTDIFEEIKHVFKIRFGNERHGDETQVLPFHRLLQLIETAPDFRFERRAGCGENSADSPTSAFDPVVEEGFQKRYAVLTDEPLDFNSDEEKLWKLLKPGVATVKQLIRMR